LEFIEAIEVFKVAIFEFKPVIVLLAVDRFAVSRAFCEFKEVIELLAVTISEFSLVIEEFAALRLAVKAEAFVFAMLKSSFSFDIVPFAVFNWLFNVVMELCAAFKSLVNCVFWEVKSVTF